MGWAMEMAAPGMAVGAAGAINALEARKTGL
jgi:hypothetical protein